MISVDVSSDMSTFVGWCISREYPPTPSEAWRRGYVHATVMLVRCVAAVNVVVVISMLSMHLVLVRTVTVTVTMTVTVTVASFFRFRRIDGFVPRRQQRSRRFSIDSHIQIGICISIGTIDVIFPRPGCLPLRGIIGGGGGSR